jgi:hypothetical protein
VKEKFFINSHKGLTGLVVLALIAAYNAWDHPIALIYLVLHGGYGILWIIKSRAFGDSQWERPATFSRAALIWTGLSLYWINPWLIVSGRAPFAPHWYYALCLTAYVFGVFLHFASDMQKHMWMKLNPGHLMTGGLWSVVRNPNYLGELLIYGGFTGLTASWAPFLILLGAILIEWLPNMWKKDSSLSRYPEFAAYAGRTKMFIPFLW